MEHVEQIASAHGGIHGAAVIFGLLPFLSASLNLDSDSGPSLSLFNFQLEKVGRVRSSALFPHGAYAQGGLGFGGDCTVGVRVWGVRLKRNWRSTARCIVVQVETRL